MTQWGVIPSIRVPDLGRALEFYTGSLGFDLTRGTVAEGNCSIARGDSRLMLESPTGFYSAGYNEAISKRLGVPSAAALYMEAADLDELYARVSDAGLPIVDPLADRPWGQREFTVADPEGNWLTFWHSEQATE